MPHLTSFPLSWLTHVHPRKGYLLLEREQVPAFCGLIIVPDSYRQKVKKSQATVHSSASERYRAGDLVLLGVAVSRRLEFGVLGEKRTLYVAHEREVLCRFAEPAQVEDVGEAFHGRVRPDEAYYMVRGDAAEEGLAVAVGGARSG